MDSNRFFEESGYFFASNSEQLKFAEAKVSAGEWQPLSKFNKDNISGNSTERFFISAAIPNVRHMPPAIFDRFFRPKRMLKKGDIVMADMRIDDGGMSFDLLCKVDTIGEGAIVLIPVGSHSCIYVPKEKARLSLVNYDTSHWNCTELYAPQIP